MAAHDYYRDPYPAPTAHQAPRPPAKQPPSHLAYAYDPAHSTSTLDQSRLSEQYDSYRTPTRKPPRQFSQFYHQQPESSTHYADSPRPSNKYHAGPPDAQLYARSDSSRQSHYTDSIPLRDNSPVPTHGDEWRKEAFRSPSSPDSPSKSRLLPPPEKKTGWKRFFSGRVPWFVYTMSLVQVTVFIVEIVKNAIITGSPIMIHPQINPMIGPSTYVIINMGARFVPCMRTTPRVQGTPDPPTWPCPWTTTSDPQSPMNQCTLNQLCGFSGFNFDHPNQWWRFIVPMFLHAGIVHIAFNLLLQLTMGREMEKAIGSIRFAIVYFSSGIFGFVLGGNFAASAIASTGASGCLFGILALVLLDLIYHWNERRNPVRELMWVMVDIVISFVLGLLPGLDNFSHIGGFLMGLAAGICILHSPSILRQRTGDAHQAPYRNVGSELDVTHPKTATLDGPAPTAKPADMAAFAKEPVGFFRGRKALWWAWWLLRVGALIGVLVAFVVLLNNFYKFRDTCSWCKYLSCLPINNWCSIGNLQLYTTTHNGTANSTTNARRDLLDLGAMFVGDWLAADGGR